MTRILLNVCAVLSLGLLALGYFLGGYLQLDLLLLVLGVLWILGLARRWDWAPPLGLLAAFGFAALGFLLNLRPVLLTPGAFFALLAGDLADFAARLRLAAVEDDTAEMEHRHLMRLSAVVVIGGGVGVLVRLGNRADGELAVTERGIVTIIRATHPSRAGN